jgi:hypothetical protein
MNPTGKDYQVLAYVIMSWPEFFEKAHIELHHSKICISDEFHPELKYTAKSFQIHSGAIHLCKCQIAIEDPECIEKLIAEVTRCDEQRETDESCEGCSHK